MLVGMDAVLVGVVVVCTLWVVALAFFLERLFLRHDRRHHLVLTTGHVCILVSLIIGDGQYLLSPDLRLPLFSAASIGLQITGVLAILVRARLDRHRVD
jgi:hypothetical protein